MITTMSPQPGPDSERQTLGSPVPPFTQHAISVSLPTWRDNVGYEIGEKRVVDAMVNGYPRFFIHLSIEKLADICNQKFGNPKEKCLLCPTRRVAEHCRAFIMERTTAQQGDAVPVRLVQFLISAEEHSLSSPTSAHSPDIELHIVFMPEEAYPYARQFWQHTGMGISSRRADRCLTLLSQQASSPPSSPSVSRPLFKPSNRHYANKSVKGRAKAETSSPTHDAPSPSADKPGVEDFTGDQSLYLEERYGRNLPVDYAAGVKRALRRRIAGTLVHDDHFNDGVSPPHAGGAEAELGPSSRGVQNVSENDVFLFPTGMSAIWQAHQLALATRPAAKSICFGFPYTDTLKILQKWGPGCHFFGHGLDADIDDLEKLLINERSSSSDHPALALFTEFPSNPLLRSTDLARLRKLADEYDFLIVVDETIGNFVNVEVLPFADIVVSSLSKIFSGDANVMGGSMVLNPQGRHYQALITHMTSSYEDAYFDEDAIFMERNARDFRRRIALVDANTEAICDFLHARSAAGGASGPTVALKNVFYPKWCTPEHYASRRRPDGGFGGLFSLTFTTIAASAAFFDALPVLKGPSLGTNFTLACPYTVLAHWTERDWAAGFGVEEGLVRVSVGMEERSVLLDAFRTALGAAEALST